ncbi:MAG: hypothetical protein ACI81P_001716 [Neolewinella sp.]|jgi:hypothetical protein
MYKLPMLFSLLILGSLAVFGQTVSVDQVYARNVLQSGITAIIPGAEVDENVEIDETGASFSVSGNVLLPGSTAMLVTVDFTTDDQFNKNAVVTGSFETVTIGKLLQGIGTNESILGQLPSSFKNIDFQNFSLTIDPGDQQLDASVGAPDQIELSVSAGDIMFGFQPSSMRKLEEIIGITGLSSISSSSSSFALAFSSSDEEKESTLLGGVSVKKGLNVYQKGKVPTPLEELTGISSEFTFAGSFTKDEGLTLEAVVSGNPITIVDGFDLSNINFSVNATNKTFGLGGDIRTTIDGTTLLFNTSLNTASGNTGLVGGFYLVGVNGQEGWPSPFGIDGVDITTLGADLTGNGTGVSVSLTGEAIFGTNPSPAKRITAGITVGNDVLGASISEISIPGFIDAFTNSNPLGGMRSVLDASVTDGNFRLSKGEGFEFSGNLDIFGFGSSFDLEVDGPNFHMNGTMDKISLGSYLEISGSDGNGGPTLDMVINTSTPPKIMIDGQAQVLGLAKAAASITITPSLLKFEQSAELFGSGLNAELIVTATDYTDFKNSEFMLEATINNNLRSQIVSEIKKELDDFTAAIVNEALKTFEIKKIGFNTSLRGFDKGSVGLEIDARLGLIKVPVNVTVDLDVSSITKIIEAVTDEMVKELEKAGGALLKAMEDAGKAVYLAGKEAVNWTGDAANTSAQWMAGALGAAGEWFEGAGGEIVSFFGGGGSSHSYDCPDEDFTDPSNGDISDKPLPNGVEQYRVSLIHIKNIDEGDEGNDRHEIWGSIMVKTDMLMQQNANPWLFNQTCREAVSCKYNSPNTDVHHYIDFFVPSNSVSSSRLRINFTLFEEDPGKDDPFEWDDEIIFNKNGMGFPMPPGQERFHTIVLEESGHDGALQTIEVKYSIKRMIGPEDEADLKPALIGINGGDLYTRSSLQSNWAPVSNTSGHVIAVSYMNDGTILGVGSNYKLYTRQTLNANWVLTNNQGSVKSVTQLLDGTIVGVGTDNKLYARTTPNSTWRRISNQNGAVIGVTELPYKYTGTLLGVGTNYKLYTRLTLNDEWKPANNHGRVKSVTQLGDGTIVGVGMDNKLWSRRFLASNWVKVKSEQETLVTSIASPPDFPRIGDLYGGGRVFYLASPGEDLNADGLPDIGMIEVGHDENLVPRGPRSIKWSEKTVSIPGLAEIGADEVSTFQGSQLGFGAANTKIIVEDYENSNGVAAKLCADLTRLGFDDWFLPSIGELSLLHNFKKNGGGHPNFNGLYWSSTVRGPRGAWRLRTSNGEQWATAKTADGIKVRPIRVHSYANCIDGILNQGETSIDCGGPCNACPTCDDGILNQGETAIDCGGPCDAVCPTCDDGIRNQEETGVDCGGPTCVPCSELAIGSSFEGGIVFSLNADGKSGLVCSDEDLPYGDWYFAEAASKTFNDGGFTDWRLPSVGELKKLRRIRNSIGNLGETVSTYWSSQGYSDHEDDLRKALDFNANEAFGYPKDWDREDPPMPATRLVRNFNQCSDGVQNGEEAGIDCGGPNCTPCVYEIGEAHAGGIIFYLAEPGQDLNGDGKPDLGLVAAPEDQSDGIKWSLRNTNIPNMVKVVGPLPLSDIDLRAGRGTINTATIMQDYNASEGLAAKLCDDLVLGGYSDWFLPSIGELYLMRSNIGAGAQGANKNIGNFNGIYWSSSEEASYGAWRIRFSNGEQWSNNKMVSKNKVRAVRVF